MILKSGVNLGHADQSWVGSSKFGPMSISDRTVYVARHVHVVMKPEVIGMVHESTIPRISTSNYQDRVSLKTLQNFAESLNNHFTAGVILFTRISILVDFFSHLAGNCFAILLLLLSEKNSPIFSFVNL